MPLSLFLRKLFRASVTLWLCVTFVFVVLRLSGDPVETILGDDAPPDLIDYYTVAWGLDKSVFEQYVLYFVNIFHGDLGRSFLSGRDAVAIVLERVPLTLYLTGVSLAVALVLGPPAGIAAALRRDSWLDRAIMGIAVSGYSLPNFFLGIVLILLFTVQLGWLPSSGSGDWKQIIMPALTMGTAGAGVFARFTRSSVLEVLSMPHVRAARARGLSRARVLARHVLINASIPIVTILGFHIGGLIGGGLVVETVFAWPGMGRLLVTSVGNRDLAVVQVAILFIAVTMIIANLTVDLLYTWIDPRSRQRSS